MLRPSYVLSNLNIQMNFISELYSFLEELDRNNNREWFNAHKEEYLTLRAVWDRDIAVLRETMSAWDPEFLRQPLKDCSYRIYRDIRFSNDKTPYKTYFSAAFSPYGRKTLRAAYYFEIGLRDSCVYGGIWHATPEMVRKIRRAISDNSEEFAEIMEEIEGRFSVVGERLKTAPKGFSPDDPMIDYLKVKQIGLYSPLGRKELESADNWVETVSERFRMLKRFTDFINYSIDEE